MVEIKIGILFLFLLLCSLWDLKKRSVPLWLCYGGTAAIILVQLFLKEMSLAEILGGVMIGALLLGAGKLTRGQIGAGDGLVFMITGIGLGAWENFVLLSGSLLLSFFCSVGLLFMKKINLKTKLPFLPFVFAAYVIELSVRI